MTHQTKLCNIGIQKTEKPLRQTTKKTIGESHNNFECRINY